MRIYVATSWRNDRQPAIVRVLRAEGFDVYDFRNPRSDEHGFSWRDIDPDWQTWSPELLIKGLEHPIAEDGFKSDFDAMQDCDVCLLVLPCGRSAHLEAGWFSGARKDVHVLLADGEPELMYKLTTQLHITLDTVIEALRPRSILGRMFAWLINLLRRKP